MLSSLKMGFLGSGTLCQNLIQGYLNHSSLKPENIFVSLKSVKKRFFETTKIQLLFNNEELLEHHQIIFLCLKPRI